MALFQTPPATNEEAAKYEPLDIGPEKVLEMTEEEWYEHIYRGEDVPQLTLRAVAVGSILGFFLAFTNLYIGLKTGWALGVAITACILSYALWTMLQKSGAAKSQMTILETNCMQSTASSAGYSTGGTMVSAIAAMLLLSVTADNPGGVHIDPWVLIGWTISLAALGTVMAIPMKRNLINRDRLKFPSGTAAAVTLQSLYSHGDVAMKKAKVLGISAGVGALFSLGLDFNWLVKAATETAERTRGAILPHAFNIFDKFFPVAPGSHDVEGKIESYKPSDWTMALDVNPVMIAAGGLVGLRIGFYMVIGGLVLVYGLGGPALQDVWTSPYGMELDQVLEQTEGATTADAYVTALDPLKDKFPGYAPELEKIATTELDPESPELTVPQLMRESLTTLAAGEIRGAVTSPGKAWKEVGLWLGVSIMLAYGILQFFTQWRTILRAFSGLGKRNGDDIPQIVKDTEVPGSWFTFGTAISGAAAVMIAQFAFGIPFYFGALAVAMTFFLAMVAARATGESDITPVGAMGKIMQLTFGAIMPQSANANLMSASITANSAGSAADLLNDLKSGYLLGANPRRQFIAQMWGIAAGTAATVLGFYLLVPDATVMTGRMLSDGTFETPQFPAPAAQAWMAIAKVMTGGGLSAMHPMHVTMIMWGLGLGTAMLALELLLPKQRGWLPSATGIGLGLILPFNYPLSMFLGAVIAAIWTKSRKENAEFYLIPIVSGLIAGISIFGVLGAVMNTFVLK
ncbi:MAG: OPT family oligopeptide transporter [Planctomycetes bacterium]|nr:OPT family oligopeptide transporter [Planctomycetota bacterium]MCP4862195.1 OPT family oligopeptide transporter [Planctomycetota bacterium]